jgi:hypothetical protein
MKQWMRERETAHGVAQSGDIKAYSKFENGETNVPPLTAGGHEILESEKKGIASRERDLRRAIRRSGVH